MAWHGMAMVGYAKQCSMYQRHVPIIKVIKIHTTKATAATCVCVCLPVGIWARRDERQLLFAYSIHLDSNRVYKNNNAMRHEFLLRHKRTHIVISVHMAGWLYFCALLSIRIGPLSTD